jgi:hypothetical protein
MVSAIQPTFGIFELQIRASAPKPPLSAALLGLSCRRLAAAGNEALGPRFPQCSAGPAGGSLPRAIKRLAVGGCLLKTPAFRSARLFLQTARCRGQRSAWQLGVAAPTPPLSAMLSWPCTRYRGRRSAWQLGAAAPAPPLFAALGLFCRRLATAGNEALGSWRLPLSSPRFMLRTACLADSSLPRATTRL